MTKSRMKVELYDDEIFLQPWFVSKKLFRAFRKILPCCQLLKFRHYFDDYGCMRCGRRNVRYGHNGFCRNCGRIVQTRIILALKRRFRKQLGIPIPKGPIDKLLGAFEGAHALRPEEVARRSRGLRYYSR